MWTDHTSHGTDPRQRDQGNHEVTRLVVPVAESSTVAMRNMWACKSCKHYAPTLQRLRILRCDIGTRGRRERIVNKLRKLYNRKATVAAVARKAVEFVESSAIAQKYHTKEVVTRHTGWDKARRRLCVKCGRMGRNPRDFTRQVCSPIEYGMKSWNNTMRYIHSTLLGRF